MNQTLQMSQCICPRFEKTFAILGKKWNGLIIEVLLQGDRRFKEICEQIPGVSDRVLVERLKELEDEGLVLRTEQPLGPIKVQYSLTEKGKSLESVMNEIQHWADRWMEIEA